VFLTSYYRPTESSEFPNARIRSRLTPSLDPPLDLNPQPPSSDSQFVSHRFDTSHEPFSLVRIRYPPSPSAPHHRFDPTPIPVGITSLIRDPTHANLVTNPSNPPRQQGRHFQKDEISDPIFPTPQDFQCREGQVCVGVEIWTLFLVSKDYYSDYSQDDHCRTDHVEFCDGSTD